MSTTNQLALVTGGASGIGLAVAEALASRGGWTIHVLDNDEIKGSTAASKLQASFHHVNVTDYTSLAQVFASIFTTHKRLDFVFANAGIALEPSTAGTSNPQTNDELLAPPGTAIIDINLRSVIYTTHLARHYFSLSSASPSARSLIITASSAGFYASPISPAYAASKHGVVGWTRSIAPSVWKESGVRVNAICPGIVRTNILPEDMFAMFPEPLLTPINKVVEVALMLMDGGDSKASNEDPLWGQTVEISGTRHYFRVQPEYCDTSMSAVMGATEV